MFAAGDFDTLVALRAKQGEFAALDALRDGRYIQPLLELHGSKASPEGDIQRLEKVIRELHGLGRLVMVDAGDLKAVPTIGGEKPGGLGELADSLLPGTLLDHPEQIPFIPVVRGELPMNQVGWIGRLCNELGAGGALRIRRNEATSEQLERLVAKLELEAADLDLVLDLQYVEYFTQQLADLALSAFGGLDGLGQFRSITLLSGSVPKTLDQTALWERPRFEEILWNAVVSGGNRGVRFGDYGVAHPGVGLNFPSAHVSVKYTCPEHWLFARERMKDSTDRAPTLERACRGLAQSDSFSGPEFSWGDQEISNAANGIGQGNARNSKSVAIGTSHHLAYLASLRAA